MVCTEAYICSMPINVPGKKHILLVWLGFWVLTMLLYWHGLGSQFVDDFLSGVVLFINDGWSGWPTSYGFTSLYYGHNAAFYGFYWLFGSSPVAWFLLFTGMHSLNATLAFGFIKRLLSNNHFKAPTLAALLITLLFLVSPYQTENVIWAATIHYGISMLCMWAIAWLYASYIDFGGKWKLLGCILIFAFSLVTLEISLVFPGIMLMFFGLLWQPYTGLGNIWRHIKALVLPMAAIMILYLGATYLLKGHFIGHYGSESHLQFGFPQLLGVVWKYAAKLIGFIHYYPYSAREYVYAHLEQPKIAIALLLVLAFSWYALFRYRKPWAMFALGWIGLVVITLLPVVSMHFQYLHQGQNDRLSYFASIFIYGAPVVLFLWVMPRGLWLYGPVAIGISIILLVPQTTVWQYATEVQNKAVDSPLFYNTQGNIYLLNLPCFYNGVYIYRNIERLHFARKYYSLPDVSNRIKYVTSTNMHHMDDSVAVTILPAPNTFNIELSAWGNWFWHGEVGDQNRKDEDMTLVFDEWGHSYTLYLPKLQPEDRLLYFTPTGWQAVIAR